MHIKTIIFDFGNVLIQDKVDLLEERSGFSHMPKNLQKQYSSVLEKTEIGKRPTRDFFNITQKILAPKKSIKQLEEFFLSSKILPPFRLVDKLRKNYRILILSNNQKNWPAKFAKKSGINLKKIPFLNSAKIGMRKPNKNIYLYMLKKYKLIPKECLFIDDQLRNLIPAKKLGLHTYQYRNNYKQLTQFLKKQGI